MLRELNVEEHIEIVPNGVDLKSFESAKPLAREKFGYKKDDVILVYAGRVALEKNLPFLIESFMGIAKAISNVHFLLIGGGVHQFEEEIHTLINELNFSNRIQAIGKIPMFFQRLRTDIFYAHILCEIKCFFPFFG